MIGSKTPTTGNAPNKLQVTTGQPIRQKLDCGHIIAGHRESYRMIFEESRITALCIPCFNEKRKMRKKSCGY